MNDLNDGPDLTTNVLVVEDDALVGETILEMLAGTARASLVGDVKAAQSALALGVQFDTIILDCLLPGGGVAGLLAQADTMHVPVIMISGSVLEIERIGGSRPSLAKPFSTAEMIALVQQVRKVGPETT